MTLAAGQSRLWTDHRVSVAPSWDSEWTIVPYLQAESFTECAAPAVPQATFRYHAGRIKREEATSFSNYPILNYNGYFIRIELLDPASEDPDDPDVLWQWIGIVQHTMTTPKGAAAEAGSAAPADQVLTAYGLEHLLDRVQIRGSYVIGAGDSAGDAVFVNRMLAFNDRIFYAFSEIGNRSSETVPVDPEDESEDALTVYVFDGSVAGGDNWDVLSAAEYLVYLFGNDTIPLTLGGQFAALENIILPKFDVSGLSLKQALDHIINVKDGFGWCLRMPIPDEDDDRVVTLFVYSIAATDATLGTQTLPANSEILSLDVEERLDVQSSTISTDDRAAYGRIIARGEHLLVCGTFSIADGTLEKGWTDDEEATYISGNGGTTTADKDLNRKVDELAHVFRVLRVPSGWDFFLGDGTGESDMDGNGNPAVSTAGALVTASFANMRSAWGVTFERNVPFFKPQYTPGMKPDWREAIVYLLDDDDNTFFYLDAIDGGVRLLDNDFGIDIQMTPAHFLAKGSADDIDTLDLKPTYDYREIAATLAYRTDERLHIQYDVDIPTRLGESDGDYAARVAFLRTQVLYVDVPNAELWYIVPGTATTVGETDDGGTIRNDIDALARAALGAAAWYGQQRAVVQLTVLDMLITYEVGSMIATYSDSGQDFIVNSVVTSKTFDLLNGTTRLTTNYTDPVFGENSDPGPWGGYGGRR